MTTITPDCLKTNFHEGTPVGKHELLFGLDTYVTGNPSKKVIVCFTDIFGNHFVNMLLLADRLAALGEYRVVVPDILQGKPVPLNREGFDLEAWGAVHTPEETKKITGDYLTQLKQEWDPEFVGTIGYCFGARYAVQGLYEEGLADAGCICHPSLKTVEEYEPTVKPLLISAAEVDSAFPAELRRSVEDMLIAKKVPFQSTLFQGTTHGFAVKGDFSVEAVRYAANKAARDHIEWFNRWSA